MVLKLLFFSLLLCNLQIIKADENRRRFDSKRSAGSPFKIGDFSLSTRSDVLSQCPFERDKLIQIEPYQEDFSCTDVTYWRGAFCTLEKTCFDRNITCCSTLDPAMESFGLGLEGNELTMCKSDIDGWKALLVADFPTPESSNPGINLLNNVSFHIGETDDVILETGLPFRVNLTREYSTFPGDLYYKMAKALQIYCASNDTHCNGIRQRALEESTGFFACYSPPDELRTIPRTWLEQNFPVMRIKNGDSSNSTNLCVSPWSYFVPLAQNKYCVGIAYSWTNKSELGLNLVEGNTIEFSKDGLVGRVADYPKCTVSSMCRTGRTDNDTAQSSTTSPSVGGLATDSPSTSAPSPKRTLSPTWLKVTLRPSKQSSGEINQVGFDDVGEETEVEEGGSMIDDLDLSPWIWFGIGCGATLFINCILLIYCRYCRRSSEPKFSRLPANVEMTATSPTVQMATTTNALPASQSAVTAKVSPSREAIIQNAAAPFEQNPTIPGGASAFEKSWNQGLIVDVWGITLKTWHQNVAVDTLTKLRLLRVASGTVSGVEKMYWVARQKQNGPSGAPVLGMIEISVDLTTKRMSAVFKMSRSAGPSTSKDAKDLHSLFEAFKLVIEDTMC